MFIKLIFSSNVYSSICKCELLEEEFEYTTEVIRIRNEEEQTTQWPKRKGTNNEVFNLYFFWVYFSFLHRFQKKIITVQWHSFILNDYRGVKFIVVIVKKLRNYLKIVGELILTILFNLFTTFTFSSIAYQSSVILLLPLYKKYIIAMYTAIVLFEQSKCVDSIFTSDKRSVYNI
jgi:hypothetical protein